MNKSLKEMVVISYGKDYKLNPIGGNIPIYGTGGVMGFTSKPLNKGEAVLTGRKGSINRPIYVEGDFWNVDTIFCIKPVDCSTDLKWIYYNLLNTDLSKLNEATGVPSVNSNALYRLQFKYFPLSQQQKIAHILSTVDAVIEKTEAAIAKYKEIKTGMMHDLFTRGITDNGQLRPAYEDAPERYKQTVLGWIPKEWDVETMDSISLLMTNGFVGVATPFYETNGNGVIYLYGNNIRQNKIDLSKTEKIKIEFHDKLKKSQLKPGDMLTVQSGHIGTSAVVPDDFPIANCHALIITRFKNNLVIPSYISYYINSETGMRRMESIFVGSTIKHVNVKEFKEHSIPLAPIHEQAEIKHRIDSVLKRIELEQNTLNKYQKLKQGLMQDLLTGKVAVSV